MYAEATRSAIVHELPGSYYDCRELKLCEVCRVAFGPAAGPDEDYPDHECNCSGDLPQAIWFYNLCWIVRRVGGEVVEAAGPIPVDRKDALPELEVTRGRGWAEAIADDVRAMLRHRDGRDQ